MSHRQLLSAVSHATGESRRTIDRLGFSLATPLDVLFDPEPQIVLDEAYDFKEANPLTADIALQSYLDWDDAWQAGYTGTLTAGV